MKNENDASLESGDNLDHGQDITILSQVAIESSDISLADTTDLCSTVNIQDRITYLSEIYERLGRHEGDIQANIERLKQIEEEMPGISEYLERELNVIDYGRYPAQLLLDQYLLKDDLENPYGILIEPRIDRKKEYGRGTMHERSLIYEKLYKQLKENGVMLRIGEVGSKSDLAKQLLKFRSKYGKKQKIQFAIIDAHGNNNSIFLGTDKGDDKQKLTLDDLAEPGVKRALSDSFFAEGATIILNSCSTGAENGLAQNLSRDFKGKVLAPNVDTAIIDMRVNKRPDGSLVFHITYGNAYDEDEDAYSSFEGGVGEWGEIEL